MISNSFLRSVYGFNKTPSSDTKRDRSLMIDATFSAIHDYNFPSLSTILTPAEYLAFLPVQYVLRRKQKKLLPEPQSVVSCVKRGVQSLNKFSHQDLLFGIPSFLDEHTSLETLDERVLSCSSDDLAMLSRPASEILSIIEYKEKERELFAKGSSIEKEILLGNIILQRDPGFSKRAPNIMLKVYAIGNEYNTLLQNKDCSTETYKEPLQFSDSSQLHPSLKAAIENETVWLSLFNQEHFYNMPFFSHFLHGFLEYMAFDKNPLITKQTDLFTSIPFLTSLHFFRKYSPHRLKEVKELSSEETISYMTSNPAIQNLLGDFATSMSTPYVKQWFAQFKEGSESLKSPSFSIDSIWKAPFLSIGSPSKAKREGIDITIPYFINNFNSIEEGLVRPLQKKTLLSTRAYLKKTFCM